MIPQTFNQWKQCIEKDCGVTLTKKYASEKLADYENEENSETKKFIPLYGEHHLQNIIQWFHQIQ